MDIIPLSPLSTYYYTCNDSFFQYSNIPNLISFINVRFSNLRTDSNQNKDVLRLSASCVFLVSCLFCFFSVCLKVLFLDSRGHGLSICPLETYCSYLGLNFLWFFFSWIVNNCCNCITNVIYDPFLL